MSGCTPETCMCQQKSNTEAVETIFENISVRGDNEWTRAKYGNGYSQSEINFEGTD